MCTWTLKGQKIFRAFTILTVALIMLIFSLWKMLSITVFLNPGMCRTLEYHDVQTSCSCVLVAIQKSTCYSLLLSLNLFNQTVLDGIHLRSSWCQWTGKCVRADHYHHHHHSELHFNCQYYCASRGRFWPGLPRIENPCCNWFPKGVIILTS